jgi:Glycosyl hydrolase family 79 C-terminal beta domain
MKRFFSNLVCFACFLTGMATSAQSPVTLIIDAQSSGYAIPSDFSGVSIFTETQKTGHRGKTGNLFSASNTQLVTLFKNTGIHHLRLGATGSPSSNDPNLDDADIDSLFAFAKATDIKVIYSLHWHDGAATAKYVWDNYRPNLDCFAFDNEPDGRAGSGGSGAAQGSYVEYLAGWQSFAQSVVNAAPGATFTGPDAAGRILSPHFAKDEKDSGVVTYITQHIYVGGNPKKHHIASAQQAIDNMLSTNWDTDKYPGLYHQVVLPVSKSGFSVRLTESDDYTHGVTGASDAFASALWALDYMHWWAEHGARGVNFQNTEWLATDTFHPDASGSYQINPKAYGIRAFDLGGHGQVEPVSVGNTTGVNLTAYAVRNATGLYVTIINKEHGQNARTATVTIRPESFSAASAQAMFLTAPDDNAEATNGVTLGGATISNDAPWQGKWTTLDPTDNSCTLSVPATSAVVIKMAGL